LLLLLTFIESPIAGIPEIRKHNCLVLPHIFVCLVITKSFGRVVTSGAAVTKRAAGYFGYLAHCAADETTWYACEQFVIGHARKAVTHFIYLA